jgi:signal transduction histidine kinase
MLQTPPFFIINLIIAGCAIILFFLFFFYLFFVQSQRRKILHQKEMFDLKVKFEKTILQSQLEIQEQTFRNISQEIHDNIGQVLSLAKLNLNTIPHETASDKIFPD